MKHVSPTEVTTEARVKGPTRRALAKQQTRNKVIAAARRLFSEHGYEGATIRDIAAAAGMSTGAVFANFSDKSDLFRDIMISDSAQLVASSDVASAAAPAPTAEMPMARVAIPKSAVSTRPRIASSVVT